MENKIHIHLNVYLCIGDSGIQTRRKVITCWNKRKGEIDGKKVEELLSKHNFYTLHIGIELGCMDLQYVHSQGEKKKLSLDICKANTRVTIHNILLYEVSNVNIIFGWMNCRTLNSEWCQMARRSGSQSVAHHLLMKALFPSWLLWWLMLLWAPRLVPAAVLQQQFRRTPDNQTATIGDTVTLACNVINKAGQLQWTRDQFGLGTERNLVGFERYRMVGSEEEGKHGSLHTKVTLNTESHRLLNV